MTMYQQYNIHLNDYKANVSNFQCGTSMLPFYVESIRKKIKM